MTCLKAYYNLTKPSLKETTRLIGLEMKFKKFSRIVPDSTRGLMAMTKPRLPQHKRATGPMYLTKTAIQMSGLIFY